jgi:hypothetical protein
LIQTLPVPGGRVHVQKDRGVAEELLDAEVEHHACRLLDAARGSGKIVEIVILLKKSGSKNQEKIFRSQKLFNARSELG